MPKKENKISVNQIDAILENYKQEDKSVICYTSSGEEIVIKVKHHINTKDAMQFITNVVGNVFIDVKGYPTYYPYARDIDVIRNVMLYYTNLKSEINIDKITSFGSTDIYSNIIKAIDYNQYDQILTAIDHAIEYRKNEILSTQKALLEKNIQELQNLTATFEKVGEQFKNIDIDDMINVCKGMASKDENALAGAILDFKTGEAINENIRNDEEK